MSEPKLSEAAMILAVDVTADSWVRFDKDNARWRKVGDTIVVMDLKNSNYFSVDGSIVAFWEQLVAGCRLSELADQLVSEFDASDDDIRSDLVEIVGQLFTRGIVIVE